MTQPITQATPQTHDIAHPDEPETTETAPKQPRYYPKTIEAFKLVEAGLTPEEALKAVNYTSKISGQSVCNFKNKLKKYSLTHPKLLKLAHNAVKDCLTDQPIISKRTDKQGQEIIEETAPTWANKIAAASMVYDRVEPTRQSPEIVNQSLTINAIPVEAQEIIDRMMESRRQRLSKVEDNIIDVQGVA